MKFVERLRQKCKSKSLTQEIEEGKAWYADRAKAKNRFLKKLKASVRPSPKQSELKRICELPLDLGMSPEELEEYNKRVVLADPYEMGWRLFPCQADALHSYERFGGLFGPIGVGWGKTLITLKIAHFAYQKGLSKILLLIPPQLFHQLTKVDIPWARTKTTLAVPFILMGGCTRAKRKSLSESKRPGCYVLPYSCLSTVDTVDLLNSIAPELIIFDEVHLVKNRRASRTRRIFDYINREHPEVVALSGTITSKGIQDYHHIARPTLGELCPLPNSVSQAMDWGAVLNAQVTNVEASQMRPLYPLLKWARDNITDNGEFKETSVGFRKAYQHRLITAPGVVATSDEEIGVTLVIQNLPVAHSPTKVPHGWDLLQKLTNQVQDDFITPNGDEIEHAIHTYKWLYELSAGMYNEKVWPTPEALAARWEIPKAEAFRLLQDAKNHHRAEQEYAKALRRFLITSSKPGYDTPMLVGLEIAKNGGKRVGRELAALWKRMKEMKYEGLPKRDENQVRVCPYKRDAAVKWVQDCVPKKKGAIIWVDRIEMGKWILEGLQEAGIENSVYCGGGARASAVIEASETKKKIVVASMNAHGQGKNLQAFQHVYFAQWPRDAKQAEQVLGRTHRNGQEAEILVQNTNNTTKFDHLLLAATLNDSLYIQQTTSLRQRLMIAAYDPMPKIHTPEFLRERGFENNVLSPELRQKLQEKFGKY